MAKLERTYVVPLRREALKRQRYKRTPKAMLALQQFVAKHMKSDDVRVGPALNGAIWAHGRQNPPGKVKVNCVKDDEGVVRVELFGAPAFEAKKEETKDTKKAKVIDAKAKVPADKKQEHKEPAHSKDELKVDAQPAQKHQTEAKAAHPKPHKTEPKKD